MTVSFSIQSARYRYLLLMKEPVQLASAAAYISVANLGEYSTSKAAALALHETLREELKHRYNAPNVRTSIITPTKVSTLLGQALNELDRQW